MGLRWVGLLFLCKADPVTSLRRLISVLQSGFLILSYTFHVCTVITLIKAKIT